MLTDWIKSFFVGLLTVGLPCAAVAYLGVAYPETIGAVFMGIALTGALIVVGSVVRNEWSNRC